MVRRRFSLAVVAVIAVVLAVLTACNPDKKAAEQVSTDGMVANLNGGSFFGGSDGQRNFNPFSGAPLVWWFTFEPLFVVNSYSCGETPWLGTKYAWSGDKEFTVDIRQGVNWSDGKPFSAADVVYTFNMLKRLPQYDQSGVWSTLASVSAEGANRVVFRLSKPSTETFTRAARVPIVPEHIWSKVKDLAKFTNPGAVGTGPFTVKAFNGEQLLMARNSKYWQADKIKVKQLTFSKPSTGDAEALRLANGEYDWKQDFLVNIEKTFVSKDKQHNKYWFPPGGAIDLYMNLTKAPFNDVGFRKAMSYSIDRKLISTKAISGYAKPASQTGLILPNQKDWLAPQYQDGAVLPFDPVKAKKLFTAAGYKYNSSGQLLGKNGKPMSFSFKVQAGYLDWISASQVIKANLKQVGINLDVRTSDAGEVENDRALGFYDMEFGAPAIGCSMFENYDNPLGSERSAPVGKQAPTNFIRWKDKHTDELLTQLSTERDPAAQKKLVAGLQQIMVEQVPYITLWYGPIWWEYRTAHAVGWPSAQDPYAGPGDWLLIFTRLRSAQG